MEEKEIVITKNGWCRNKMMVELEEFESKCINCGKPATHLSAFRDDPRCDDCFEIFRKE